MTDRFFLREAAEPVLPAPRTTFGAAGWLRTNLFFSGWGALVTVIAVALAVAIFLPLVDWAIIRAHWTGETRAACLDAEGKKAFGACWAFIEVRFSTLMYGFYPVDERWRVNLFAGLTLAALVLPSLLNGLGRIWGTRFLALAVLFPLGWLLLHGGVLGLPMVETSKWGGLMLTLIIAGSGMVCSFPLGILLALGRRSELPVIRTASIVFIEVVRGVPLVTVLFMASVMLPLFLPNGVTIDKLMRAIVGVSLFTAAYVAEVMRGGLQAIPKGQYEAAQAIGLSYWRQMRLVILPQAMRIVIPGILNTYIGLLKDTTLVAVIGLVDLIGIIAAATADPAWLGFATEGYVFVGLLFWVLCYGMSRYGLRLEYTLAKATRR